MCFPYRCEILTANFRSVMTFLPLPTRLNFDATHILRGVETIYFFK